MVGVEAEPMCISLRDFVGRKGGRDTEEDFKGDGYGRQQEEKAFPSAVLGISPVQ